ncbi:MAG: 2-C-methyl-D-erythritol 4-phosphate cytidylyltransferase [Pseudolysinimonas sp.]|uniref:2-C-methyl-D-erythritol 4-phosphate cytidylyltransferase n=1 Tax=Pseudolysinimonas sp. TaxID=2680009 RepID=UPI00326653A9
MSVAVIVVAAGSGERLGAGMPKAFARLASWSVLDHALVRVPPDADLVVVAPASHLEQARVTVALHQEIRPSPSAIVVAGGGTRQQSVAAGLAALGDEVDVVLVHDAARALAPIEVFERVVEAVRTTGEGVIPVLPVTDTVKRVHDGVVVATVDRADLVAVQTPQGFPRAALEAAYAAATVDHTDDAALFAAAGHSVATVPGDPRGFKITTPDDLHRAAQLLGPEWAVAHGRGGVGYDVHAYDPEVRLRLGGLDWPGEPGLSGHSDGDAVIHAIVDALLSAAGLGDIGSQFGTDRPEFAGAASAVFLERALSLVAESGWQVANVAVQIVGAHPKIGPRRQELEEHLSALVGAPVAVGATTSDRLGFTGDRGLGAIATVLLAAAP